MSYYVGLMSGTSMDGVDAALVSFPQDDVKVEQFLSLDYPASLRARLGEAIQAGAKLSLHDIATLNVEVGIVFAKAAHTVLQRADKNPTTIAAIGSHGQTLRHSPDSTPPYSVQIGDAATIAHRTGITTVADFRSLDIAAGGQGAPLVPAFHEYCFKNDGSPEPVVNIGGIANITVIPSDASTAPIGFDTGPGNCLMDEWCYRHRQEAFDRDGHWAASGAVSQPLLDKLKSDPYFSRTPPKSTGREFFNLAWLDRILAEVAPLPAEDVQATLLHLSVSTIAECVSETVPECRKLHICGGGAFNQELMDSLQSYLSNVSVQTTAERGIDPGAVEAAAFAWFAKCRLERVPIRISTDDAARERMLGAVYRPNAASMQDG